ncbi:ABC transporter permease subunit [Bacillus sp. NTK074B]|uniref:ABC transporter permease subunit n=1 Tax=Bacillus sp. NTK074B TaxID=2802174 RepID=UPI001A9054C1|nr:ABC transporter permease subunit [Bacillus sp. NTK074B]
MNVFVRELKAHRKSLMIWCMGMVALIGSGMGKYAGYSSSGQSMNDLMAGMPKSLQAFLGFGTLDLSTASGYYGMLFLYILLMATIHAAMIGATIISKEERDKTVEFLFVKPLKRKNIIGIKLLAALTQVGILTLTAWISSLLFVGHYSETPIAGDIGITMLGMFILQVLFLVSGSAIASYSKQSGKAGSFATGVLLFTFILSFAIDLSKKIEHLKYFTPFKYFEAKNVMYGGGLEFIFVGISLVLIVVLAFSTFLFYDKRDLNV